VEPRRVARQRTRGDPMVLRSPPLRRVSSFLEEGSSPVSSRLSEPLWQGGADMRLMVRCIQLHTILECETTERAQAASLDDICASRPRVRRLIESMCEDGEMLRAGPTPMALLEQSGFACMCPLVGHYLGEPDKVYRDDAVPLVKHHLEQTTGLNQLLVTATQLRQDMVKRRFKYTAHKLALLYHAVNLSRMHREVLRKRIEERFEDVKAATEAVAERAALPDDLIEWICGLCDEVCAMVRAVPPSMQQNLHTLLGMLHELRHEGGQ